MNCLKERFSLFLVVLFLAKGGKTLGQESLIKDKVSHHYVMNDGVKIHYVSLGKGPTILFIHGFPDFWYTWRVQMETLSTDYRVIAMDLRGYNLSDAPSGVDNYTYEFLMSDVKAVIEDTSSSRVQIVAHDWGAGIAWRFAAEYPEMVERLAILSIAHPKAGSKKIPKTSKEQESSYGDYFVSKEFEDQLTENWFSGWVKGAETKNIYKDAFRKSNKKAMLHYYRANFPTLQN